MGCSAIFSGILSDFYDDEKLKGVEKSFNIIKYSFPTIL